MARASTLFDAIAVSTGIPVTEMVERSRYLREHDLFVRQTKSPRSWKLPIRDAANLLAAVISGYPATHSADGVAALAALYRVGKTPGTLQPYTPTKWPNDLSVARDALLAAPDFLSALESAIELFVKFPQYAKQIAISMECMAYGQVASTMAEIKIAYDDGSIPGNASPPGLHAWSVYFGEVPEGKLMRISRVINEEHLRAIAAVFAK